MKVKKLLCALFAIAIIMGATNLSGVSAKAATLDEADLCLVDTIELIIDENIQSLNYSRQEIFNYEFEPIGYGYETEINGKTGFALMIKRAYYYEVTELYLDKQLPYAGIDGTPIYLTPMCYIEYADDQFIDIENGYILDEEQLHILKEKGFGYQEDGYEESIGSGTIVSETIYYHSRTVDEGKISGGIPGYFDVNPNLTGTCAVQAGAVVLGYYARYFPELTPGFTPGMVIPPSYTYFSQGTSGIIQSIINDLYVRMGTNVGGAGTTAAGFRQGLQSYVNSKGRNITYTSVVSNNTLNFDLYKSQIANLKPSVLFFNTYNVIPPPPLRTTDNSDYLERKVYPGMHVMIGYGYKQYKYYISGVHFRNDTYIEVYTGVAERAQGFIKLYDMSILVEGQTINIY